MELLFGLLNNKEFFSMLEEENRYYNWYYGFSSMSLPYLYKEPEIEPVLRYEMKTNAITGKNNQKNKVIPKC